MIEMHGSIPIVGWQPQVDATRRHSWKSPWDQMLQCLQAPDFGEEIMQVLSGKDELMAIGWYRCITMVIFHPQKLGHSQNSIVATDPLVATAGPSILYKLNVPEVGLGKAKQHKSWRGLPWGQKDQQSEWLVDDRSVKEDKPRSAHFDLKLVSYTLRHP